jgi:transcriptional regulator with XRE-family HTH domain
MDWKAIVGENIRAVRTGKGLSIEELADRAGMAPSYVGQIERAQRNASIDVLGRIAEALDVSPGLFWRRE